VRRTCGIFERRSPPYVFYGIVIKKRSTERAAEPATGQDPVTAIRLSKELRDTVEIGRQTGRHARPSEAVRLLVSGLSEGEGEGEGEIR